jgi:hypothetical protein
MEHSMSTVLSFVFALVVGYFAGRTAKLLDRND